MTLALALRQICCDEAMPSRRAVFQCRAKYPEFAKLYTTARYDQIEGLAGEAVSRMSAIGHKADISTEALDVRFWGKSGHQDLRSLCLLLIRQQPIRRRAEIKTGHCLRGICGPQAHNHPTRRNRQNSAAQAIRITPMTVK